MAAELRRAELKRKTKETEIALTLQLDVPEAGAVMTGVGFFDHMLTALAFYAGVKLELVCKGDLFVDAHHSVEDCGIVLGQAFKAALGEKTGIRRFASAFIPMDEALAFCALDISGRPYLSFEAEMPQEQIGDYPSCLTEEFLRAFVSNAGITMHVRKEAGRNAHHITEAIFKAVGSALRAAVRVEGGGVTSTKGLI